MPDLLKWFGSFVHLWTVLDDDDVGVMDMVGRQEGDLSRPRPLTGSAAKEPAMEEYSLESGSKPHSLLCFYPPWSVLCPFAFCLDGSG